MADLPGVVGVGEAGDPFGGGGEHHAVSVLAGAFGEPDGQVGFAGVAGRAEKDHVFARGDKVQGAQMRDGVAFESASVVEVGLFQGFSRRESGGADAAVTAVGFACGDFSARALSASRATDSRSVGALNAWVR